MSLKTTLPKTQIASNIPAAKTINIQSVFDAYPDSAFVRESQLVQSPKRPATPTPLPFSAPTLWRMVAKGTFPQPTKLSERVTAWNVGAVRSWLSAQESQSYNPAVVAKPIKLGAA